jgi:hypothetical protein
VALEPLELTIRPGRTGGMGGTGSHTRCRSRLIRYPDAPRNRSTRGKPPRDGVGTGFSHTVEFSRNVAGLLFGESLAVPASRPVAGAAGTVPRACRDRQRLPTCTGAYSLRSAARHVDAVTQKRRPAPGPSERRDGHRSRRTNPLGVRRPPVFRCRRRWRRPGEVLGPEELPCLQPSEGSTARDAVSTCGLQQ